MTLEPHLWPPLNVQHHGVPAVASRHHSLRPSLAGQLEEALAIEVMHPGEATPHLVGVDAAT